MKFVVQTCLNNSSLASLADIAATFSNSTTLESILSFNSASNLSIPASLISNCLILCSRTSSLP